MKAEFARLADALVKGEDIRAIPEIEKHADWAETFAKRYDRIGEENVLPILEQETGRIFLRVLEDAGVFKRTAEGQAAFDRFLATL